MKAGREHMIERILAEIELAVKDGAKSVILGCNCMSPVAEILAARVERPDRGPDDGRLPATRDDDRARLAPGTGPTGVTYRSERISSPRWCRLRTSRSGQSRKTARCVSSRRRHRFV